MARDYDVAVVGAGIAGVSAALELARRGVSVTLLDRGDVAGATTGLGEGNVLCARAEPGPKLDLTRLGLEMYDELEAEYGTSARIRRKGALVVHRDEPALRRGHEHVERMRAAGVACRVVERPELRELEPRLGRHLAGAELFPGDLQCDARGLTRAMAGALRRHGACVNTGTEVHAVRTERGRAVGLDTADGPLRCGAVVLAAGPWSAPLAQSAGLRLPVEPRKGQLTLSRRGARGFVRHKLIEGAYAAAVTSDDATLQLAAVIETTWDGRVMLGSSRERRGFDTVVDSAVTAAMVRRAAGLVPELVGLPLERSWAGLRPFLPDHHPAVGPSSLVEGLWVSTGHEGAGVALGPVSGRLLAEAFCGEAPKIDMTPFAVDRFQHGHLSPRAATVAR